MTSFGWLTPAFASEPPTGGKGVNVMTRYMMVFGKLENKLLAAQGAGDKAAVIAQLNPFFELNTYDHKRLTRDAFAARKPNSTQRKISGLRVYEVGENAIANFVLQSPDGKDLSIVDVWSRKGQDWQLRLRFESNY
ncbi:nuclear transport factor 2 family protein [Microbulbifer sp. SAOS-129_SWC]|uniref:nuclear transport factor 2 family protein n=1 Tax=Microbulbifer sp. SAOS-129_SWC TaxID=3145235 RepID=UPI003217759B